MKHYTYFYADPKTGVWRYVGKGDELRPLSHLRKSSNRQLHNLLKKRMKEGFDVKPLLIEASSEEQAFVMERFWIAVIGREDQGNGTLFNKTEGGEGVSGKVFTSKELAARSLMRKEEHRLRSEDVKAQYAEARRIISNARTQQEREVLNKKTSETTRKGIAALSEEQRKESSHKKAVAKIEYHRTMSAEVKAQRSRNIVAGMAKRKANHATPFS